MIYVVMIDDELYEIWDEDLDKARLLAEDKGLDFEVLQKLDGRD